MNRYVRPPMNHKVGRVLMACFFIISSICLISGCEQTATDTTEPGTGKVAGTVQLEIDFQSDRRNVNVDVPCSKDSTVFTILERAQNLGDVKFKATGESNPESTFVNSIGGVDNLAAKGDNWIYLVNGKLGDKSAALYSVEPGDEVTWVFGKYEPE